MGTYPIADKYDPESTEIALLLEGIYKHYGYDFRNYSYQAIRRRIWYRIKADGLNTVSGLQEKVLHDRRMMDKLFSDFSVNVTEMFRDPTFFQAIRRKVFPVLRLHPTIRIWHAGCSTGEEAYSMAILLHEEGLYHKSIIYATDMNADVLNRAEKGVFPLSKMRLYTRNYQLSGGKREFSEYYKVNGDTAYFDHSISENIVFSQHNLATDHSFNEFHIIICRNVLIYFDDQLQQRVFRLFLQSLAPLGYLGLGSKEGIVKAQGYYYLGEVDAQEKIFRKITEVDAYGSKNRYING